MVVVSRWPVSCDWWRLRMQRRREQPHPSGGVETDPAGQEDVSGGGPGQRGADEVFGAC